MCFAHTKLGNCTAPILGGFCSLKLETYGAAQLVQRMPSTETDRAFANRFLNPRFPFHALSCKVSGVEVDRRMSRFANMNAHHFGSRAYL